MSLRLAPAILVGATLMVGQVDDCEPVLVFPLRIHSLVGAEVGESVDAQTRLANEVFAPARIRFAVTQREFESAPRRPLALGRIVDLSHIRADDRTGIDVFVVDELDSWAWNDGRPPDGLAFTRDLMARLQLPPLVPRFPNEHLSECVFIVRAAIDDARVLAHELGHLFGLEHSSSRSLMRSDARDGAFTPEELSALRTAAEAAAIRGQPSATSEPCSAVGGGPVDGASTP